MSFVGGAVENLIHSITHIGASLATSLLAVFHAIVVLFENIAGSAFTLAGALVHFVTDLFSGLLGFVLANFLGILIVIAVYYGYTQYQGRKTTKRSIKSK